MNVEKERIDCVTNEYQILWTYYLKTLNERDRMIKNFLGFIGIPSTILTIVSSLTVVGGVDYMFVGITLITISLIGASMSINYTSESITASRYLNKIQEIRMFLSEHYKLPYYLFDHTTFNTKPISLIHKVAKSVPLPGLSSLSMYVGLYVLLESISKGVMLALIYLVIQLSIHFLWIYRSKSKNTRIEVAKKS